MPRHPDPDDQRVSPNLGPTLSDVIESALVSRRGLLRGLAAGAVGVTVGGWAAKLARAAESKSSLGFTQVERSLSERDAIAPGYRAEVLVRWGDQVLEDADAWKPLQQTERAQLARFGFNCDYNAYLPLPQGSDNSEHGLLWSNHEYTDARLMHPNWSLDEHTAEHTRVELAAHGGSVLEVKKTDGKWEVVGGSDYARRITGFTEMRIAGPAAGHDRLKTSADDTGTKVLGTFGNCGGGKTPWGTVLIAEENFNGYFSNTPTSESEARNFKRYGLGPSWLPPYYKSEPRFDLAKEPHEPNRFGWVVEIDPYDPEWQPVKRTSLGRIKHEAANTTLAPDGRVVVYTGDDQRFEYLYRFVSSKAWDPEDRAANRDLLDDGVLSVARFDETQVTWLPLVFGEGPLTPANDFHNQADVLIETRRAADLLGATPMDRPEDVETNPVNGRTYVMLTNNTKRKADQVDAANPRAKNYHGQIVELVPPGDTPDHTADVYTWDFLLLGGDPARHEGAQYHPETETWLTCPDNCAFDPKGRLWIATDQGSKQARNGIPDGLYACDVDGPGRGILKCLYTGPLDAELTGPEFTPDGKTLFASVQHPAEQSSFDEPNTRWPDFDPALPPRSAVIAITKEDGGAIGD
jgi:secreted PhoX family phosphatase